MLILHLFPDFTNKYLGLCLSSPLILFYVHFLPGEWFAVSAISSTFTFVGELNGSFMIILHQTSTSNVKVSLRVPERANSLHVTWTSAVPVKWEMKIMELFCCSSWLNSCVHPPRLKPGAFFPELKARGQRNTYNKSSNPPVSGAVYCNPPPLSSPLWPLMFSHLLTVNVAWIPGRAGGRAGFMQSFNLNLKYHQLVQRRLAAA